MYAAGSAQGSHDVLVQLLCSRKLFFFERNNFFRRLIYKAALLDIPLPGLYHYKNAQKAEGPGIFTIPPARRTNKMIMTAMPAGLRKVGYLVMVIPLFHPFHQQKELGWLFIRINRFFLCSRIILSSGVLLPLSAHSRINAVSIPCGVCPHFVSIFISKARCAIDQVGCYIVKLFCSYFQCDGSRGIMRPVHPLQVFIKNSDADISLLIPAAFHSFSFSSVMSSGFASRLFQHPQQQETAIWGWPA